MKKGRKEKKKRKGKKKGGKRGGGKRDTLLATMIIMFHKLN